MAVARVAARIAVVAATLLAGSLMLAGAASAAVPLRGAQLHPLWANSNTKTFDRELDALRAAGANAVRIDIGWSSLQENGKNSYSSSYVKKTDTFIRHARTRGLNVIATFWETPCWASSAPSSRKRGCSGAWWKRGVSRYPPRDASEYATAAAWVARRWGSQLAALEIWNEPNLNDEFFLTSTPARDYAQLLKAAYPQVKAAAPGLTVIGGSLGAADGDFLKSLYGHGIHGSFDGFSIHPYNGSRDPSDPFEPRYRQYTFITGVPWIHQIMSAHGDGGKGVWLTEFGFSTCKGRPKWCVSPAKQASYLQESFQIADRWSFVKAAIVYNLRDRGNDRGDIAEQYGLLRRNFQPKPAYAAFKRAVRR